MFDYSIENIRNNLKEFLASPSSPYKKLFAINLFYDQILNEFPDKSSEIYILEFIDLYLNLIQKIDNLYLPPENFYPFLENIQKLKSCNFLSDYYENLSKSEILIQNKISKTQSSLEKNEFIENNSFYFPILEISKDDFGFGNFAFLESIDISIKPSKNKTTISLEPQSSSNDILLFEQLKLSFNYALDYVKKKRKKIIKHYEISVTFKNKFDNYCGNSFGIALTLVMIEKLLQINNTFELVKTKNNIALTGGHDENGNILQCGEESIEKKVEMIFYSDIQTFIVPKEDEQAANEKLKELQKDYPNREPDIIPIKNIKDLFNRRDLIEIKKQNIFVRGAKEFRQNWQYVAIIFILFFIVGFYFYRDIDDNPAILDFEPGVLNIKNQQGRILFKKFHSMGEKVLSNKNILPFKARIIDINNDGTNEVLLSNFTNTEKYYPTFNLICLNKYSDTLWLYRFKEKVSTINNEIISEDYANPNIIDTITLNNSKLLTCFVSNIPDFTSAIFFLDLKTGKRKGGILWHAGHIVNARVYDIDNDGKYEVIFHCANNAFEKIAVGVIEIEKIFNDTLQSPATKNYELNEIKKANFRHYILLPKTDYLIHKKLRNSLTKLSDLIYPSRNNLFEFSNIEDYDDGGEGIGYYFSKDFTNSEIVVGSNFRVKCDSLVKKGILNKPYSDTKEYKQLLESQILHWDGSKFISRKEWLERQKSNNITQ